MINLDKTVLVITVYNVRYCNYNFQMVNPCKCMLFLYIAHLWYNSQYNYNLLKFYMTVSCHVVYFTIPVIILTS